MLGGVLLASGNENKRSTQKVKMVGRGHTDKYSIVQTATASVMATSFRRRVEGMVS